MNSFELATYFTLTGAVTPDKQRQFAGREEIIAKSLEKLAIGQSLVIFGERGVGKTSFGWQLLGLCTGDNKLLQERNINVRGRVPKFHCLWLTCVEFMSSASDVIFALIKDRSEKYSMHAQFPELFEDDTGFLARLSQKYSFSSLIAKAEYQVSPKKNDNEPVDSDNKDLQAILALKDLFRRIRKEHGDFPILVFLDEFDRIQDNVRAGVLVKALNDVQWVTLGVAGSRKALVGDHPSIVRKITGVGIPLLGQREVAWFFSSIEKEAETLRFSRSLCTHIFEQSSGFPWLMQNFGYMSALEALYDSSNDQQERVVVMLRHYKSAIKEFLKEKLDDEGLQIDQLSSISALMLTVLAQTLKGRLPQEGLLQKLPENLRPFYDPAITALREQGVIEEQRREVRLKDPLFKVLIQLSAHEGLFQIDSDTSQAESVPQ